jgi:DNA-binding GntR family transcriptional regulator
MTERAYRHIRHGLASGQFRSGAQLSDVTISQQIGVGRTPVREALLLLANEGFIEQVPRYGTFVKKAGRHERQSLYELREVLESYAAGKAAEYISDAAIAKLGELCEEIHAAVRIVRENKGQPTEESLSRGAIADMAFHMLILKASGNPLVIKSVADMHLMSRIWGGDRGDPYKTSSLHNWVQSWREHVQIYRAIRKRDGAAAQAAMSAHLRHATIMALENYDQQCRTEGADAVGYEWPKPVQDAISRFDELGPEAVG